MITGTISSQNEPRVSIGLPFGKRVKRVKAVVDTGFNGYVALPKELIVGPGWRLIGSEKYEVATGSLEVFDVYLGKIRWNKTCVPVYALVTCAKDVLIGTKLLQHSVLTVDFPGKKLRIK